MARHNASEVTRGSILILDGKTVEGVVNLQSSGGAATTYPDTDLYDTRQQFAHDIPNVGRFDFQLKYNPHDDTHEQIRQSSKDGTIMQFEWLFSGKKVNGVKTNDSVRIGATNGLTASSVTAAGVLTTTKNPGLNIGDYLEPTTGDTLIVTEIDRSTTTTTYKVKKDGAGNITAVTASKNYTVKRPAAKMTFSGFASGFNVNPGGGTVTSPCSIIVTGDETIVRGTPDLP